MIVVDANIVAFLVMEGEWSSRVRRLLGSESDWRIPAFWRYEMANVLFNYVRFKGMSLAAARGVWDRAMKLPHVLEMPVDPGATLELVASRGITAYDAQYVALAMGLDTVCVTGDRRLRKAVPSCVRMLDEIIKE